MLPSVSVTLSHSLTPLLTRRRLLLELLAWQPGCQRPPSPHTRRELAEGETERDRFLTMFPEPADRALEFSETRAGKFPPKGDEDVLKPGYGGNGTA